MPVNADKPHLWKADIAQSVDFYNSWFMQFAPQAYRDTRIATTQQVESALARTANHNEHHTHRVAATSLCSAHSPHGDSTPHRPRSPYRSTRSAAQPGQKHGRKTAHSTPDDQCQSGFWTHENRSNHCTTGRQRHLPLAGRRTGADLYTSTPSRDNCGRPSLWGAD
nr:hypothetical protein [Trichocoleus sp. FACHB-90]